MFSKKDVKKKSNRLYSTQPAHKDNQSIWWIYRQNRKSILLAPLLLFCVLTYKGLIPYNEEILVALCFCAFVVFCFSYLGNTIQESLDERSTAIQNELQDFLRFKQSSLRELRQEHKKIAHLKRMLLDLYLFTKDQLSQCHWFIGSQAILSGVKEQYISKLTQLALSKSTGQEGSYKSISENARALVLAKVWSRKATQKRKECFGLETLKHIIGFMKA